MSDAATYQALGFTADEHPEGEPSSTWGDLRGAFGSGISSATSAFGSLAPNDEPPPPDYSEVLKWGAVAAGTVLAFFTVLHLARKV